MRVPSIICVILLLASCKNNSRQETPNTVESNLVISNKFVDAFYSFNQDTLKALLSDARESQLEILNYQKWAECGHYQVIKRNEFIIKSDSLIKCPVTVKDDLMAGLNINFNVTDTFHLTIIKGKIRSVETSSNDLDVYYEAKEWVRKNRPALVEKPCEGSTPCECILGMIKGFKEFVATAAH